MTKYKFCQNCVFPSGLGAINPATGKQMRFQQKGGSLFCEACAELLNSDCLPPRKHFDKEFENYLHSHRKLLYAYSGGLDSTVTLALLVKECQKRKAELDIFTINTGVKGVTALRNVGAIIRHLGLEGRHFWVDIAADTVEVYCQCLKLEILPCGRLCNTMIDFIYQEVMKARGYKEMITGGDTPKKGVDGKYSIFWKKPSGITIVRGGYAFNLSKKKNMQYIKENKLPWIPPKCGGYDTDCLIPGVYFAREYSGQPKTTIDRVVGTSPIILDYLSERVRFGIIERAEALKMLVKIDVASLKTYIELEKIFQESQEKQ